MLAEGFAALADEGQGHGVSLYRDDGGEPIVATVTAIPAATYEGQVSSEVAAYVLIGAERPQFDGAIPSVGAGLTDQASGTLYRIVTIEDLPSRPCILFTCAASKATQ